jgi:hypothetical protein
MPRSLDLRAPRSRRGAALPTALLLLAVLAALAGGAFAMSTQSFRGGRNAMIEQRAFAVAESGLNQQIGDWNQALNGIPQAGGLAVDSTVTARIFVANGDTSVVRVTRLDQMLFSVQSFGRASIPNPQLQATRSVAALVRVAYPTINPQGAITANGDVDIQGASFEADGRDRIPYAGSGSAWNATRCAGLTGADTYAIAVPPGAQVKAKPQNFPGPLTVNYTPIAGDPNTYLAFGTETMNTLIQNADLRYNPGALPNRIEPSLNPDGSCRINDPANANWGEPFGGAGAVARCQTYFPIIYVAGSASLQGNGRGQGILIVDGDLQINGTFDWVGLVLVKDDMNKGNGTANITGAVMARNFDMRDPSVFGGSQSVNYSKCAVESALRGSAILIRVADRSWTQLF